VSITNQIGLVTQIGENTKNIELPQILTQDKPHASRSERYSLVKTIDIVKQFENLGFTWKLLKQEKCRGHYAGYGTHLVSFEHPEVVFRDSELGKEIIPRIYLRNSYHGRSRLQWDAGVFRSYCDNGLFVGTMLESLRKRHIGINPREVQQVMLDMKKAFSERLVPMIQTLIDSEMSEEAQLEYAKSALAERLRANESYIGGEYEKLLTCHRVEDKGHSTWKVLNRVQENLGLNFRGTPIEVKYQYMAKDSNGNNQVKERKVSKIGRIDEVVHMNKFLFDAVAKVQPTNEIVLLQAA
jgi:hypothetical protein